MSNIEINPNKEYILAADISASMSGLDPLCGGDTRYRYMLEKFKQFVQIASDYDEHGAPTVLLFGERVHVYEHCDKSKVESLMKRETFEGFTYLDLVIKKAFDLHMEEKNELNNEGKYHPGTVLMVFTDGEPTNRMAVKRELENILKEIQSEDEFQIMFLTVGTINRDLSQYLENLHEDLENKKINPNDFDIIHVDKLEDVDFMGAVSAKEHKVA